MSALTDAKRIFWFWGDFSCCLVRKSGLLKVYLGCLGLIKFIDISMANPPQNRKIQYSNDC